MKAQAPCKNCPDRCIDCHPTCQKYKTYKAELQKIQKMKCLENASEPSFVETMTFSKSGGWERYTRRYRPKKVK